MTGTNAHSAPATIAGGELDATITNADVYAGVPARATVVPGAACRATKSYVEQVRTEHFADIVELFATDAVVLEPARGTLHGHNEINQFYTGIIGKMKPDVIDVAYTGRAVATAIEQNSAYIMSHPGSRSKVCPTSDRCSCALM